MILCLNHLQNNEILEFCEEHLSRRFRWNSSKLSKSGKYFSFSNFIWDISLKWRKKTFLKQNCCLKLQFRFAKKWDVALILTGIGVAILKSTIVPISNILFGEYTALLVDRTLGTSTSSTTTLLPLFGGGKTL